MKIAAATAEAAPATIGVVLEADPSPKRTSIESTVEEFPADGANVEETRTDGASVGEGSSDGANVEELGTDGAGVGDGSSAGAAEGGNACTGVAGAGLSTTDGEVVGAVEVSRVEVLNRTTKKSSKPRLASPPQDPLVLPTITILPSEPAAIPRSMMSSEELPCRLHSRHTRNKGRLASVDETIALVQRTKLSSYGSAYICIQSWRYTRVPLGLSSRRAHTFQEMSSAVTCFQRQISCPSAPSITAVAMSEDPTRLSNKT